MELRQLRYFVRTVELGSLSRAARDLEIVPSALSQQIARLEGELATRLLRRSTTGVTPTEAGLAFFRQAKLALLHAEEAARVARDARLSGTARIGLPPTTSSLVGIALIEAMRQRYPDVRLQIVESLSGHLADLLRARELDVVVQFKAAAVPGSPAVPVLEEELLLVMTPAFARRIAPDIEGMETLPPAAIHPIPLVLPSRGHSLRAILDASFAQNHVEPTLTLEIDSLALLMESVAAGIAATIQPGAALARIRSVDMLHRPVHAPGFSRPTFVMSLPEDELSSAALAARIVLLEVMRGLVRDGRWPSARLQLS